VLIPLSSAIFENFGLLNNVEEVWQITCNEYCAEAGDASRSRLRATT
jgi:hypothetical protein